MTPVQSKQRSVSKPVSKPVSTSNNDVSNEYYSPFHQIMNRGCLCLISKPYFKFASYVMKKICFIVNIEKLRNERQEFLSSVT